MNRSVTRIGLCLFVTIAGCGGPSPVALPAGVQPTHNGAIVSLARGKGYVELVVVPDNPKATVKNAKGYLVAYFMNPEGGPADPVPTEVSYAPEGSGPVKLAAGTDKAAFKSEPGSLPVGRELNGELNASFGGQAVKSPVATR